MTAYYNEHDKFAAAWLMELIAEGVIAPGVVDERPIQEVVPSDVEGFTQCHFFAGIGVWSYALRCAGWPDDRPVWTGSCPCQPFSAAGRKRGFDDERHLWPAWHALIRECRPPAVFGEQVASEDGLLWFDAVFSDMEGQDYAVGAADLCAAGVGAPHLRQRLFFVAESDGERLEKLRLQLRERRPFPPVTEIDWSGETGVVADSEGDGRDERRRGIGERPGSRYDGPTGRVGDAQYGGREGRDAERAGTGSVMPSGPVGGFWSDAEWIPCRDGKLRPTKPGIFPLASGVAGRVGQLRGAGNALCAPAAEAFVRSYLEARG